MDDNQLMNSASAEITKTNKRKNILRNTFITSMAVMFFSKTGYWFFPVIHWLAGLSLIIAIVSAIMLFMSPKNSNRMISCAIGEDIVQKVFPGAFFNANAGLSEMDIRNARIFKFDKHTTTESENLIVGNYKGVDFKYSAIRIKRKNKYIRSHSKNYYLNASLCIIHTNTLPQAEQVLVASRPPYRVKIDNYIIQSKINSVDFDRIFTIYSDDEYSISTLLTKRRLEYLMSLTTIGHSIYASFDGINGDIYLLIENDDTLFETDAFAEENEYEVISKAENKLNIIKCSIDELL